jgi:hypothetical protein
MTKFKTSDLNDQAIALDDAALDAVVGGAKSAQETILAATQVAGWGMKDVFARYTIGTFLPHE